MAKKASSDPGLAAISSTPPTVPNTVTGGLTLLGLLCAVYAVFTVPAASLALSARIFLVLWLAVSVAVTFLLTPRHFTAGFLCAFAAMLIGWRIAGLNGIAIVAWPLLAAFIAFVAQFFDCASRDRNTSHPVMTLAGWHLTFIRLYIGFDMVPHFTEKLFAGPASFQGDVTAFRGMGLPDAGAFVIVGGLCEFAIMVGFGLGLFTRLAGLGAALYFLIATVIGGHFFNGFIWANSGGGWEYPVLMIALFLSFVYSGSGAFSLDRALIASGRMPRALRVLSMRAGHAATD